MAQGASINNQALTAQSGYTIKKDVNHLSSSEDAIIKKTPLTGAKVVAHKITKDIFSYAPKGLMGSANSNFYEFLSLGTIPYIIGSAMLIGLFNGVNNKFNTQDAAAAGTKGMRMAAGVILYAAGKWLGGKLINNGVKAYTGIDADMPYKKIVKELSDYPGDPNTTSVEFHKVFESTDFPRWDLINKQGEKNGNRYEYYDKIAKKMGYEEKLSSPDQITQPAIKKVITKSIAAKSISTFLWAALGVAIGAQKPFGHFMKFKNSTTMFEKVALFPKNLFNSLKDSTVQLFKGGMNPTKGSKFLGKALIFAAVGSTALGIMNSCRGFKEGKKHDKPAVDLNKEYVEV